MFRKSAAATLIVSLTLLNPAQAKDNLPEVGHQVNFYTGSDLEAETGKLDEIKSEKRNPLNKSYVWVRVKVLNEKTKEYDLVTGWYKLEKPGKKKAHSCCSGNTTPVQNVVVVQNNHAARVPELRHYAGPVSFSVVNNNQRYETNNHSHLHQAAPVVRENCSCGLPIRRYHFGPGGVRNGHYCRTTGRLVRW